MERLERHACIYEFNRPEGQQEYGITHYAEDLLAALVARKEMGKDPSTLLLIGKHSTPMCISSNPSCISTGVLVLKRAFVLALGTFADQGKAKQILRNCSSISFFGTPRKSSSRPTLLHYAGLTVKYMKAQPFFQTPHIRMP